MTDGTFSTGEIKELLNHDDFQIIWCGSHNSVSNELVHFTDPIEEYSSFRECYDHIIKIRSHRKILLVLTDFYETVSELNDLPQIQFIYILNENLPNKPNYSKVVNVFKNERILIKRLQQDILLTYRNELSVSISPMNEISIEQGTTNFEKTFLSFHWNQLFTYYLVHSSNINMNQLKENMINQCQLEYYNNPTQLDFIKEFEKDCTEDNVLKWYTKDTFVYRLVNKAFRTRNIHFICKFRYVIILLYKKLKQLSIQQQNQFPSIVYRGQIMKKKELEIFKSKIGHLISTNTIMSTSIDKNIARGFAADAEVGVIFHIHVTNMNSSHLHPFADISRFSSIPSEEEILFFSGSVFRIDSIDFESNSLAIIKLTSTNQTVDDIEKLIHIFQHIAKVETQYHGLIGKTDDYRLFAKYHRYFSGRTLSLDEIQKLIGNIDPINLMNTAGDYQKSIEYYKELLKTNLIDGSEIFLNIIIGNNYFQLEIYDEALTYYSIGDSLLDEKNRLTGEVQNRLGDTYREMNDLENALACYKKAFQIISHRSLTDKNLHSICLKIVDISRRTNNYEDAMIYEYQAKELENENQGEEIFSNDQTLLKFRQDQANIELDRRQFLEYGNKLYRTGMHLIRKGEFSKALEHLLVAEQIFKKQLPSFNLVLHKLAKLYEHVAFAYSCLNDYFNALIQWKRAIDIRTYCRYHSCILPEFCETCDFQTESHSL